MSTAVRRLRRARVAAVLTVAVLVAACAPAPGTPGKASIVASFYPLRYVAEEIGGDQVTVNSLTPDGADPHNLELSPHAVALLGSADLVLYLSGFQAMVDDAM